MSETSETQSARSNTSNSDLPKSNDGDPRSAMSEALNAGSIPWNVSFTQTECEVNTPFSELAWSVQQLCQKFWPTSYEEVQIARLDGGSFNRIVSLTLNPSTALRPVLSQVLPTNQSKNPRCKSSIDPDDKPAANYILRISRWEDSDIEHQIEILSYVRLHTDIPIPRILAYDVGSNNTLERPYTLQKRIPGVPLNKIINNLTFSQRLDLVSEIASIVKKMQKIESPAPGKIGVPKTTKCTSLEEKLAAATITNLTADRHGLPEQEEATPTTEGVDALQVLHFDLITMFGNDDPYNHTVNALKSCDEGRSVLSFFNFQFTRQMLHQIERCHCDVVCTILFHRLMQVAIEMDEELDLGTDVFNFYHGDLEPRNIMVQTDDSKRLHITGVIDWDLAAFFPRVVSCLAPRWLWAPNVDLNSAEREDERDPTDSEAKALKERFDELMGDDYVEMAYESHYALLRRLFHLAVSGINTSENFREAEAIISDWAKMKALFQEE